MNDDILEVVKLKLKNFGYEVNDDDLILLENLKSCCDEYIKNFCNITEIPQGLFYARSDMICGEFLLSQKACGKLNIENLCLDSMVKSIQEGDVTVVYSDESIDNERKIEALIEHLIYRLGKELLNYRCVRWS